MDKSGPEREDELQGAALTREMFLDAYMAGTSDGVFRLEDEELKVEREGYDEDGRNGR